MTDYDVCRNYNPFYFAPYMGVPLVLPDFFPVDSQPGQHIDLMKNLIASGDYAQAVSFSGQIMPAYPAGYHNAFIAWQVVALWHQGAIPTSDLIVYLTTLEGFYPKEAFLNFDKAILYIKEKQFNEAMQELKTGRKKDSQNSLSVILQFWICYFSGDEQWRSLYKIIHQNGLLSAPLLRLIDTVEAIKESRSVPLYLGAVTENVSGVNEDLFKDYPDLKIDKLPQEPRVLMVACDSTYLHKFVLAFLLSARELPDRSFGLHVHVYEPQENDLEILQKFDRDYPELKLSYSWEEKSSILASGQPPYYACMRFCRAYQILQTSEKLQKIAVVDADSLLRQDPFAYEGIGGAEVVLSRHETAPAWDQFAAGFTVFSKTETGLKILGHITNILLKNFRAGKDFWLIDQIALFDAFMAFSKLGGIKTLPLEPVFGKNMEHGDGSLFWTYTNDDKTRDNPMNREKDRLLQEAGIKT